MSLRPADPDYLKLLLPYGEAIQKLTPTARKLILEEAPEATEFVCEVYTIADHFSCTEQPSEAFVFTTRHADWVNLGFNFGSLLPDPAGLLRGEGKWIRHVRIARATDLDAPAVQELVRAAIAQAERPEGRSREASYRRTHGSIRQEALSAGTATKVNPLGRVRPADVARFASRKSAWRKLGN